mmetsp:Transcript_5261/g.13437  ORF Transcript_5261/g.13437 Transcript_5261/m.13437 type:complete len:99 (-) Transcript_5261:16-312(-)
MSGTTITVEAGNPSRMCECTPSKRSVRANDSTRPSKDDVMMKKSETAQEGVEGNVLKECSRRPPEDHGVQEYEWTRLPHKEHGHSIRLCAIPGNARNF